MYYFTPDTLRNFMLEMLNNEPVARNVPGRQSDTSICVYTNNTCARALCLDPQTRLVTGSRQPMGQHVHYVWILRQG